MKKLSKKHKIAYMIKSTYQALRTKRFKSFKSFKNYVSNLKSNKVFNKNEKTYPKSQWTKMIIKRIRGHYKRKLNFVK